MQVIVAAGGALWVLDADACVEQPLAGEALLALAASPDGRFIAGFSAGGYLRVWTADFTRVLTSCDTGEAGMC